jgi:response regulator RpfG family c-di-GMP phosphodiesterase
VAVAMAVAMAERAGLGPEGTRDLMRAALLHDIGKLGVSNRILNKPGSLTNGGTRRSSDTRSSPATSSPAWGPSGP